MNFAEALLTPRNGQTQYIVKLKDDYRIFAPTSADDWGAAFEEDEIIVAFRHPDMPDWERIPL